jgi:hypothetical protein
MANEIQRLRATLARMRPGQGRRYGARVRARIAQVAKQMRHDGASWRDVGEALGMPLETVRRICADREATAADFVPVEIAPDARRGEIALVTPGGHRVEGLDLETVAVLLARLA